MKSNITKGYVYILASNNNSTLYVGVTNDLTKRIKEHKSKEIPGFTAKYNCVKLVYYEVFDFMNEAIAREKQLKNWHREWKENLINSMNKEWKDLSFLLDV